MAAMPRWFSSPGACFAAALLLAPLAWLLLAQVQPLALVPLAEIDPWRAFSFCLLYPVLEELVFRGALQGALLQRAWGRRRFGPLSAANLLTSVAFSLLHLVRQSVLWSVAVFPPSLLLGLLRERYGNTRPGILLHVFYNSGYFLLFAAGA